MCDSNASRPYYPVLLNLEGQRGVVLGGGPFALAKVTDLLAAGARVILVAETVCDELEQLAGSAPVTWVRRSYRTSDLAGAAIAVDASEDERINDASWRDAEQAGVLLNVVGRPQRCRFIAPAGVRRGAARPAVPAAPR